MHEKVDINKTILKTVFLSFLNILMPALNISNITQTCIPLNAFATKLIAKNSLKKSEMVNIIIKDGITTPTVVKIEPKTLPSL